jgi:hypothetical protein
MPNWCNNSLYIEGPEEDIKSFRARAYGPTQSYNEFIALEKVAWPIHDDIRVKSLVKTPPDLGESVDFSFHSLYPVPEDFRCFPYDDKRAQEIGERVGETRAFGGYNWESKHWGVKWGACQSSLEASSEGHLEYSFDTPWGPPEEFFEKISQDWKTLSFDLSYYEPGHGFRGSIAWANGERVSEEYHEFEEDQDDE